MDNSVLTPLKENGVNVGQVGTNWPSTSLLEDIFATEPGFIPDVTEVRELAADQPMEVEQVLSLSYAAPLRIPRPIAENLLSHYFDLWLRKENAFKSDIVQRVMAYMLVRILRYVLRRRQLTLDDSNWPLDPYFICLLRLLVKRVSAHKGCRFLIKSDSWKYTRWYFRQLWKFIVKKLAKP